MDIDASPLAAMQPQGIHSQGWLFGGIEPASPTGMDSPMFGPKLERPGPGSKSFFDLNTCLDSSPTSNLVVDLSQNFHIDKTPQIPTPRRSLFTGLQFGKGYRNEATTPPIPASSPGNDSMEMSPLPHKVPYHMQLLKSPCAKLEMRMQSSPPVPSPADLEPKTMDPPRRPLLAEFNRKRAGGITRPGLSRSNRFTTSGVSFKAQSSQPSFSRSSTVPQINLEQLFSDASPERIMKQTVPDILVAPPPKFNIGLDGSPVPPSSRTSSRVQRPKGKVRRTISMFEHAEDVMAAEKEDVSATVSPDMMDPAQKFFLPSFVKKDDPLRRIDRSVLCDVLDGKYQEHYDELVIVDCRFEYEYEGGHIAGAININTIDTLEERFLNTAPEKRHLVIFHCEYSAHRAPRMALHLRKRDRQINIQNYPNLHYPNVYILEGGYSSFWREYKTRCDPQEYVEMDHADHKRTCERELGRLRRVHKFGRAQTFTYGFGNDLDSSPSATLSRRHASSCDLDDLTQSSSRSSQRRMASY